MKTIIHVNQHNIRANAKGENRKVLTVKSLQKEKLYIHLTSHCHVVQRFGLKLNNL